MNRSRYINRPVDRVDRAIIAELAENARMTVRELASSVGLSSPSVTERIRKLEDSGAIASYTITVDPVTRSASVSRRTFAYGLFPAS